MMIQQPAAFDDSEGLSQVEMLQLVSPGIAPSITGQRRSHTVPQFLSHIASKRYPQALLAASDILRLDPSNPLILEYVPVIKQRIAIDTAWDEQELREKEEGVVHDSDNSSDEEEDEDDDEDDDDEDAEDGGEDNDSSSDDSDDADDEDEDGDGGMSFRADDKGLSKALKGASISGDGNAAKAARA
ncbi:hypothetical protein HK101_002743 [Irineochytrium annulatum]|nr:hypothetical protein HK101_002743 [Irineochytrium annulatum]